TCCAACEPSPPSPTIPTRCASIFSCPSRPKSAMLRLKRSASITLLQVSDGLSCREDRFAPVYEHCINGNWPFVEPCEAVNLDACRNECEIRTLLQTPAHVRHPFVELAEVEPGESRWHENFSVRVSFNEASARAPCPLDRLAPNGVMKI